MNLPQRVPDPLLPLRGKGEPDILSEPGIIRVGADSRSEFLIRKAAKGLIGVRSESLKEP
jgi:hypothetical protein